MRCVVISNGSLTVEERPDPVPGRGDALIAVRAAGLNAADLLQRRGFYPAPAGWPIDIPGLELAGEVRAVGPGVNHLAIGQRVCAVVGGGAQSSMCVVPAEHLISIPPGIEMTSAGGFAEAFTTAYDALIRQANVQFEERVLISGAAGGVGSAAVQITHAWGAHAIAVTRDEQHHRRLRSLGAAETVTTNDVGGLAPVDVVLELIGAPNLSPALSILAPHARVVVIGIGGGPKVELDLLSVMVNRATITGSTLRARSREEKAVIAHEMTRELVPHWIASRVHVPISLTFPLDRVNDAYDAFGQSGKFGKIILTTN